MYTQHRILTEQNWNVDIFANGCNETKSKHFKGVWILSVPTVCLATWVVNGDVLWIFTFSLLVQTHSCVESSTPRTMMQDQPVRFGSLSYVTCRFIRVYTRTFYFFVSPPTAWELPFTYLCRKPIGADWAAQRDVHYNGAVQMCMMRKISLFYNMNLELNPSSSAFRSILVIYGYIISSFDLSLI